uniref:Uncharacterized protein n=1 Tax=Pyxicephalus adspersus TaxID=30357 RepID=A0AAV3AI21_PYXAD|nr:TPA: hypothetical protein GDO54_011555 [Pyxicephalus adspersus]
MPPCTPGAAILFTAITHPECPHHDDGRWIFCLCQCFYSGLLQCHPWHLLRWQPFWEQGEVYGLIRKCVAMNLCRHYNPNSVSERRHFPE